MTTALKEKEEEYLDILALSQLGTDDEAEEIKGMVAEGIAYVKAAIAREFSPLTAETFFELEVGTSQAKATDTPPSFKGKVLLSNQNIYTFLLRDNGTIMLCKPAPEDQSW